MRDRLCCPICNTPLVSCEHIRSVGYQDGQIIHIKLYPKGEKVYRKDLPRLNTTIPTLGAPVAVKN